MNRTERRRKEREDRKSNKFKNKKVYTFEDFMDDKKDLEKVYICNKCGLEHEIEYTEIPILDCIKCTCGNQKIIQIHKGLITWRMKDKID
ncbi:hypothetical protein UMC2_37031 [[Clostridium] sordellii]|uniref:hypothetical protein n=1 Tax=Paraclostridium sordellii TaxID=1505 RepID=UPI000543AE52|nr:hypothetical protein [Paeniclostridium sordellii]CEK34492.1 hypothetical protein UMC2_37031 [[Clostridium] sordellii] [Paeniclostridium sordellii]